MTKKTSSFFILLLSIFLFQNSFIPESLPANQYSVLLWTLLLFFLSIMIGFISILAGVGGGILYITLMSNIFPFHIDFIRGASLFASLSGTISASPQLLKKELGSLKITIPFGLIVSIFAILGANVGLNLEQRIIKILLGILILIVCFIMLFTKKILSPVQKKKMDKLTSLLKLHGTFHDDDTSQMINWTAQNTYLCLILFAISGFLAGLFGLGAGWANVPILNLIMGLPLKTAVANSILIISIGNITPAWVYLKSFSLLPIITIPSMLGMIIGSRIGANYLKKTKPAIIKYIVIIVLLLSGTFTILKQLFYT